MTTYQGIAVASQALRLFARNTLHDKVPAAHVRLDRPEETPAGAQHEPRLNIYLVQVAIDPALRSGDLPTRETNGGAGLLSVPRLPLILRYLFSYFGPSREAQLMLGAIEVALHASPVLAPTLIQEAVTQHEHLQNSGLDKQEPPVRIVPATLSLDTLARFWSGFFQTAYTLSTVHDVGPVIVSSQLGPAVELPVQKTVSSASPGIVPAPVPPPAPAPQIQASSDGRTVTVTLDSPLPASSQASLSLYSTSPGGASVALEGAVLDSTGPIEFPLPTDPPLPGGEYLVWLTVGGVSSELDYDGETYTGPHLTIP